MFGRICSTIAAAFASKPYGDYLIYRHPEKKWEVSALAATDTEARRTRHCKVEASSPAPECAASLWRSEIC